MQWGTVHDFSPQSLAQPISTLSLSGSRITVRWSFKNLHSSGLSFFRPLAVPSASDMVVLQSMGIHLFPGNRFLLGFTYADHRDQLIPLQTRLLQVPQVGIRESPQS